MKLISLNNGTSYLSVDEAMPLIYRRKLWDKVVNLMDSSIREQVRSESITCTRKHFLTRYLELASDDLILGTSRASRKPLDSDNQQHDF
ncbi:MAG: hypothetical protein DDT21_02641 [Syntrophomonadaceae bacterium]|nr:hypothetical protein [Bacillota bacterium]